MKSVVFQLSIYHVYITSWHLPQWIVAVPDDCEQTILMLVYNSQYLNIIFIEFHVHNDVFHIISAGASCFDHRAQTSTFCFQFHVLYRMILSGEKYDLISFAARSCSTKSFILF